MPENRSRFVLLCQQSLVFGLVVAIAAPATNMVTLEFVAPPPDPGEPSAAASRSVVATAPVRPRVSEVALSGVTRRGLESLRPARGAVGRSGDPGLARLTGAEAADADDLAVLSDPEPVENLATVGVTWKH